jgi:hypothetical protein
MKLKKNPDICDYVVEQTYYSQERTIYGYYNTRAEARADAKFSLADRVRIFRAKFTLVSDSKKKAKVRK